MSWQQAWVIVLVAAGAGFPAACNGAQDAPRRQPAEVDQEVMVLGPFPLGELCRRMSAVDIQAIPKGGGPSEEALVKALNRCKAYLLVRRWRSPQSRKWVLRGKRDDFKVVLEGKFSYVLSDMKGEDFKINVSGATFSVDNLYTDWGPRGDTPPHGRARIGIQLETSPYRNVNVPGLSHRDLNFVSPPFQLTVNGEVRWGTEQHPSKK